MNKSGFKYNKPKYKSKILNGKYQQRFRKEIILNLGKFAKAKMLRFSYTECSRLHFLQTRIAEV